MENKEFNRITVIGGGTMGNGIAHTFSLYGYKTLLLDISDEVLQKAEATITKNLNRQVQKEKISQEDLNACLARITFSTDFNLAKDSDLVIEAVSEKFEIKEKVFKAMDNICNDDCIFASNTSSISITKLASTIRRPENFIGMHFMNPVPIMKLIEVIKGYNTSDQTSNAINHLSKLIGKTPVEVNDYPGFIANRILMPMINEAIYSLYEGVAGVEQIDSVMKLGMNHPMGPLALADFIGLDVCLFIMEVLYDGFKNPKYAPCPLLVNMVQANKLGKKNGEGFYKYEKESILVSPSFTH